MWLMDGSFYKAQSQQRGVLMSSSNYDTSPLPQVVKHWSAPGIFLTEADFVPSQAGKLGALGSCVEGNKLQLLFRFVQTADLWQAQELLGGLACAFPFVYFLLGLLRLILPCTTGCQAGRPRQRRRWNPGFHLVQCFR